MPSTDPRLEGVEIQEGKRPWTSRKSASTRPQVKQQTKSQARAERRLADFNTVPKGGVAGFDYHKPGSQNRNKSAPAKTHR